MPQITNRAVTLILSESEIRSLLALLTIAGAGEQWLPKDIIIERDAWRIKDMLEDAISLKKQAVPHA